MDSSPPVVAARAAGVRALATGIFDVMVIGGGITGAGIARDAALRGLSVALIDKGDFASGTSSKSTKLVHGGLRYLEQGEVKLVFESVSERARLTRLAPHLVRPIEFLVPSYRTDKPGLFIMDCGLWLYDAMSKFSSPKMHKTYRKRRVEALEPGLRREDLRGGIIYYDCATDDARLTIENVIDANALGATLVNYVRAVKLVKEGERFTGAVVIDELTGITAMVRAKVVINATGPWCDEVRALYGAPPILGPTKGVHIVVDAKRLPLQRALLVKEKKRAVFCLPWGARSVIGTTDTFYDQSPDDVHADHADVSYLLEIGNHYFPAAKLTMSDVLATWAGLRPLLRPPSARGESAVSREHHIESVPGLVTVAGGKLTTYRIMAAEVVDHAATQLSSTRASTTQDRPLPGGEGVDGARGIDAIAQTLAAKDLDAVVAIHLARTYGARALAVAARIANERSLGDRLDPELPFVMAEVDEAVEREHAMTLADVFERRVPLLLHSRDQGLHAATSAAPRMAQWLAWSEADLARELDAYRKVVASTRRFRTPST